MSHKTRFVITILAVVSCLSISSPGRGQEAIGYSLRTETELAGAFLDPVHKRSVWFDASAEDGVLTLRLDLYEQSVTLRQGRGELHVDSSNNAAQRFSTLSEEEREILRRLASSLEQELESGTTLDSSVLCMVRNLSSWPADMPLFVSVDAAMKTVGEVSISIEEIREARQRALDDLRGESPHIETEVSPKDIVSLCNRIGRARRACYPTRLKPYTEKCENVLVGGTSCRGRCGTTCNGLCTQQRYTQDCHSHDRCADVHGISHRYCNFIFPSAFDDCAAAPDCVDLPGVWSITFKWTGFEPGTTSMNVDPNREFTSEDGAQGTWKATDKKATFTVSTGCRPIYTGALSRNRLTASGTMRCRTQDASGTWSASKTDEILPAKRGAQTSVSGAALDGPGVSSPEPN